MKFIFCLVIFSLTINFSQAVLGVDVSQPTNTFSCMATNGMQFAISRGYLSYGAVDTNGVQNLKNIKAAGLIADAYFFPCRGKSASTQANEFMDYYDARGNEEIVEQTAEQIAYPEDMAPGMRAGFYPEPEVQTKRFLVEEEPQIESNYEPKQNVGQLYGTIWLDVEINPSSGCSWASFTAAQNCVYVGELINAFKARGKTVGIYSSQYMWTTIMGTRTACTNYSAYPLWYAHYDGVASFSDWSTVSFGGWTKPAIKQYQGDVVFCNSGVDRNFY